MKFSIKASGVSEAIEKLGDPTELIKELDRVTEKHTRLMANESADNAPVKTGRLASSIPKSVEQEAEMSWIFGSDVEYATRQEYEHASKKAFFRKSLWNGRTPYRDEINETIARRSN